MARPGLEPGTPRFSGVRVSLSNRPKIPANKPDAHALQRARKTSKFRSVLGDSGDRWRPVAGWCASAAGGPHSAPGRAPAARSSRARTASVALPRAHLEQWPSSASARSHRHAPATAAPSVVSTAAFHGRRSVVGADRAAPGAPSRSPKEYVSGHDATGHGLLPRRRGAQPTRDRSSAWKGGHDGLPPLLHLVGQPRRRGSAGKLAAGTSELSPLERLDSPATPGSDGRGHDRGFRNRRAAGRDRPGHDRGSRYRRADDATSSCACSSEGHV
jgi:hypothetical protein